MSIGGRVLLAAIAAAPLFGIAPAGASEGFSAIQIRIFDASGLMPDDLRPALDAATRILGDAGIATRWLECSGPQATVREATCGDTRRPAEFFLRLALSPRLSGRVQSLRETELGWSLVDVEAATGVLATVFPDRVQAVARAAAVDDHLLLGRVIAHEIGHLLLGTHAHADRGLMRAHWSRAMLQHASADDWRFTPLEVASMRTGLLARLLPDGGDVPRRARVTPALSSAPCVGSSGVTSTGSSASRSTISSNCY